MRVFPRSCMIALAMGAFLSTPVSAREKFTRYLVEDAAGGSPVVLRTVSDEIKESKARSAIGKTGVSLPKDKKLSFRDDTMVKLEGIADQKGKQLLAPAYTLARPISTRVALVKRWDNQFGLVDLKTREFRPIPPDTYFTIYPFSAEAPMRMVLGTPQPDGTVNLCVVDPMGQCDA